MLNFQTLDYLPVPRTSIDTAEDIEHDKVQSTKNPHTKARYTCTLWTLIYLLAAVIIASSYAAVFFAGLMASSKTDEKCLRHTSTYCLSTIAACTCSSADIHDSTPFPTYVR